MKTSVTSLEKEPQAFVQPASSESAQEHLRRSIESRWNVDRLRSECKKSKSSTLEMLESKFGEGEFGIWGVPSSPDNERYWKTLREGDWILFYTKGKISYLGEVAHTDRDAGMAEGLWGRLSGGSTWELLYFLKNVVKKDVSIETFARVLNYGKYLPQKFQTIKRPISNILAAVQAEQEPLYFILQTGGGEYADQPENMYHFKQSIPGSTQLRSAENTGRFVYYENKEFYGKGAIGKITSEEKDGTTHYYAEILGFERLGPVRIEDIKDKLGFDSPGQPGIRRISKEQYDAIVLGPKMPVEPITIEKLQEETLLQRDFLETISRLLEDRKQVIFFGPPGTGKTFVAKKFAMYFTGRPDNVEIVQFHPSYSYEDFVEGIRPRPSGTQVTYPVEDGIMKILCRKADQLPNQNFLLIVDEINRGNIAKIFGELIHCLEYRGKDHCVSLAYSQKPFYIPENLYILGTMNSADRSIALVDFALRRRFNFIEFFPQPELLRQWLEKNNTQVDANKVTDFLTKVNERISNDDKLGEYFQIGHSYFMKSNLDLTKLSDIWNYNVMPLLKEYFFEEREELEAFQSIYRDAFKSP